MDKKTIILILFAFVTALLLALFQYVYKQKNINFRNWILTGLRTLTYFLILLLLVNPQIERVTLSEKKPNLVVAFDNSMSMSHLGVDEDAILALQKLKTNEELNSKFNVEYYQFGDEFEQLDTLDFNEQRTDFSKVLITYKELYKDQTSPMILISDGNQTYGSEVSFVQTSNKGGIFPVILGDTTAFEDLSISEVNHNRYVFQKNRFEVETILNYEGTNPVKSNLQISHRGSVVFTETLNFNRTENSKIIRAVLSASSVGVQDYKIELSPLSNEPNLVNNVKEFAVEVIDQKTKVALIYNRTHPDIGALRKAITSNDQREVTLLTPDEYLASSEDFQLYILYQPDANFNTILNSIFEDTKNTFVISGPMTDWQILNAAQNFYKQEVTYEQEFYQPVLNPAYSPFILSELKFDDYPPLTSEFGTISFNTNVNTGIFKSLNGNETGYPQFITLETSNEKHGLLLGEGIWRWRAQNYLNTGNFEDFDNFISKLVQYLSSNKRRKRLVVDYQSFYNSSDELVISAQFFNKSYEPDNTANLSITLKNIATEESNTYPMLFSEQVYRIDLSGISSGNYEFTVMSDEERIAESGTFKVIAFNIEQQFLRPNVTRLQSLATNSGGRLFDLNGLNQLTDFLNGNNTYQRIQRESRELSPLIDLYYLLGLIALTVSLEWFIRKYNGLI
jgi:hypothetical protein